MSTIKELKSIRPILFAVVLILVACTRQEPIQIIITPTPNPSMITATVVPTLEPSATPTNTPEPSPTPTVTNTPEPAPPTNTPESPGPTPTFMGSIIGPDYVLPTLPPPPTQPLQEIPTVTPTPPGPTAFPTITETPGPSPTALPELNASQMGVQMDLNLDFDDWMRAMGLVQTTGVGWVKIQLNWALLQPEGPINNFSERLQLFERQVEAAARPEGVQVMLSIAKAPSWTRSTSAESGPPDNPQDLADFITFILNNNNAKIGKSVDAIEIWNEPNLQREWQGTLPFNGAGYMQLFRPAYDAIRAYSPDIMIVTAGLAPTTDLPGARDDRAFLQEMYNAGLANYLDIAVGVHPYGWGNPPDARCCQGDSARGWDDNRHFFFIHNIEDTREIMVQNGHQDVRMWVTEFGWPTWEGLGVEPLEEWMKYTSAQQQANYAIRAFEIGQEMPFIGPMILWNLNFANATTVEQQNEVAGYSIINPVLPVRERPLFWALNQVTATQTPTP